MQAGTRDLARRERARVFFGEFDKQFDGADEGGDLHVLATLDV